jgi:hypothetical protein
MKSCFMPMFILFIFHIPFSKGNEIPILKVISEPEDNLIYSIFLEVNSFGEIQRFKRKYNTNTDLFEFKKMINGFVLFRMENREVLFMECPICDNIQGGELMIRFLKNGITNQYSEVFLGLEKKNEIWGFFQHPNPIPIKTLFLKSNKLLGKVIGIKEIEINFR